MAHFAFSIFEVDNNTNRRNEFILAGTTREKYGIQWCPDISPGPVQPDNGTIWEWDMRWCFCVWGVFGLNKFTFSRYSTLTVSVIIKRYFSDENALKVVMHIVL